MQNLDEQIKKSIQEIMESSEAKGLSIDSVHKLIFERLGGQYGPEAVERNLLALTVDNQDFNPYDKYSIIAYFFKFLRKEPKFIFLIFSVVLIVIIFSFGVLWLDK